MFFDNRKCQRILLSLIGLSSSVTYSDNLTSSPASSNNSLPHFLSAIKQGYAVIQLGGYISEPGKKQHIDIETLIGDEFTVTSNPRKNVLIGLGYFLYGQQNERYDMSYGINVFYLPETTVSGHVIQENFFENLSYSYNVTHYPIYAMARSAIKTNNPKYALIIDLGVGPNFIRVDHFKENSLDGVTLPDNIFSGKTTTTFSATAGISVKINQFFDTVPLVCGYRFFYLGKGNLKKQSNQVINALNTGDVYANALTCSVEV